MNKEGKLPLAKGWWELWKKKKGKHILKSGLLCIGLGFLVEKDLNTQPGYARAKRTYGNR